MSTFKVRDRKTGLFSTGGCKPKWTKVGKTWSTLGQLKAHLTLVMEGWDSETGSYKKCQIPDTWEVVEYVELEKGRSSARTLAERSAKR